MTEPIRLLYDTAGAAIMLSTSERRVDDLRRAGMLPAVIDGNEYRYRLEELRNYTDSLPSWKAEPELHPESDGPRPAVSAPDVEQRPPWASIWLTRDEVATQLRIPKSTLASWASQGIGPTYSKFGRTSATDGRDRLGKPAVRLTPQLSTLTGLNSSTLQGAGRSGFRTVALKTWPP
jgi:hypothetical protein